ncbi:glycosyltransferase [Sediminibacterium sp.]|uniref:glycosyltransferase n=1 Tax=Sediminibacterium sp. TaxID=1917865 RepID=UPI003F6FE0B0
MKLKESLPEIKKGITSLIICEGKITRLGRVRRTIELLLEMGAEVSSLSDQVSTEYPLAQQILLPQMSVSMSARISRVFLKIIRRIIPSFRIQLAITKRINGYTTDILKDHQGWDIVIVEHIDFLPLACELKRKKKTKKIFFDIRDFYPREFEKYPMFLLLEAKYRKAVFKHLLRECDEVATVSYGLVEALQQEYGTRARLLRSIPSYEEMSVKQVSEGLIRLVHHGSANSDRLLGEMIDLVKKLDKRFTLDLYLVGDKKDVGKLKMIAGDSKVIRFHDPVPFDQLISTLNQYDAGFFFFVPTTFNIKYGLPNKLFEIIQARLMVITSPLQDIARVVNEHACGLVLPSFDYNEAIPFINAITAEDIMAAKYASDAAARILCFEEEKKVLQTILSN